MKLTINRKLGGDAIPAHVTTLSVSSLNNQFKAVAIHRGSVAGSWERPGESDGPGNFEAFIREAVQQTGYSGQTVSLLLAHPRLVQQLADLPPVKRAMVGKLVQRQAQQQKFFPGDAAWTYQICVSSKSGQRVILHLFPRLLLNQLVQGCKANGLHLTSVLPASAVLHRQLTQLPLEKEEVGLLAAETGGSTTLVIGRSDGQILLARTLPGTWNEEAERLAVDLNRTILFANQQYGLAIHKGLWLFGPGAQDQCQAVQRHIQFPVNVSPTGYNPFYWATEALKLRPGMGPNFISLEQQKAPQRRVFAKVVAGSTGLVVAGSLAAAAYSFIHARQEAATIKVLSTQSARLQAKENQLRLLDQELSHKKQVIQLVIGERPPPAPAWLLAYLAEAVPSDLVVTNLQIRREADLWKVRLDGAFQPDVKQPTAMPASYSLALLKERLAGGPFRIKILHGGGGEKDQKENQAVEQAKPSSGNSSIPAWLDRVTSSRSGQPASAKLPIEDHFVIEGVMR